eukprot:TRINITY_DN2228_c0_g1_i3.p1 TRINITY_DN2228_c0_g1~~TRINITY_DN2228_c0_g1_i3.p1  ORF type:complete len:184 (+),score=59.61 TRINITY_DN2228_c0_g1_i3:476-1027(+)
MSALKRWCVSKGIVHELERHVELELPRKFIHRLSLNEKRSMGLYQRYMNLVSLQQEQRKVHRRLSRMLMAREGRDVSEDLEEVVSIGMKDAHSEEEEDIRRLSVLWDAIRDGMVQFHSLDDSVKREVETEKELQLRGMDDRTKIETLFKIIAEERAENKRLRMLLEKYETQEQSSRDEITDSQ